MTATATLTKHREHLARQTWPRGLRDRGLECPDSDHIAYFYADKRMGRARKGLFLYGLTGSGKTTVMRVFHERFQIPIFSAIEIANEYMDADGDSYYRYFCERFGRQEIIIDDLGSERNVKKFGNESIIGDIIAFRERVFQMFGILTHLTSNLVTEEDISARYGDRILSRIVGMCDIVMLTGQDRRRPQ